MSHLERSPVKAELDRLTMKFFQAVSFEPGETPSYASIAALFIERGLRIKNVGSAPEISSVQEFITPRKVLESSGTLTRFHESEILGIHRDLLLRGARFSAYAKSGTLNAKPFEARGMITTQSVNTPEG